MGTLVGLDPPAPRLAAALRERGAELSLAAAEAALRAEIAYYKAHHLEGRDERSLAGLRRRCAAVLWESLPGPARSALEPEAVLEPMLAAIRFSPAPGAAEVLTALRARGLRLVVVSNWDVSLTEVLADLGLAALLDGIVTSAGAGVAKPDPAIFAPALRRAEATAAEAVHVGDSPDLDVAAARAAGIAPVLIGDPTPGVATIPSLAALPDEL